ncbi:MAG: pilus (MSHA type) biogenesis protein MshL [Gammaproteobacteria bacterium]|nr:pilus (MSHA type) biogenesis protein MshL [Gammaproteobacteria bacterium]
MQIINIKNRLLRSSVSLMTALVIVACGATNPPAVSEGHIRTDDGIANKNEDIPLPITQAPTLPRPGVRKKLETYTVVVNQVPVRELLFSMARDADLNLDIDNNISGSITMNAIDQTMLKILERIESQADITFTLEGDTIKVMVDKPYLHIYDINYLNIERSSSGKVSVSTEIGASSSGIQNTGGSGGGNSGSGGDNTASSEIENKSSNKFWSAITQNIGAILEVDVASKSSNNIIVNRESGIIAVRATSKQHKVVKHFIDRVVGNVERQVLIEATIAEVRLSDSYQAGIDWSLVSETAIVGGQTVVTKGGVQDVIGGNLGASPFFQLATTGSIHGNPLNITLKALETFGDVKVLSSPKVMALNNQTAILKVVDNEVFFTTNVEVDSGSVNQNSTVVIDTDVNTVPIGFVMSVTPFIDAEKVVTLNVRPTISRIIRFVNDPNPLLAAQGVVSQIPVIQVREIETMLKINNGETAIIGGLMQDQINKESRGVPFLSSIPLLGALFSYTEEEYVKSELVIFIRPVVIENASLDGDLANYKKYLLEDLQQETSKKLSER